ncbi:arabinan endo-1,5-alpha-L-arabinosidase [Phototrophicus methaneseepsis]|uniref:Arabinan endo-1,5-alpha-L-arabinosidase n=2 Tax=Phototrophicus methaneseepsis TaxID=2710758 RepID=A0A7S8EE31_9CHLR|nr:arabinan endo-1,5-alpha-L-arabinosidase [Phototrophicus methaneseepsis]
MAEMTGPLPLTGNIRPVHDPVMIKENDKYYLFCTGPGMSLRKSDDMLHWTQSFPVRIFGNLPDWVQEKIPNQNDVWAPDISYYNDKFHLYYSVSTFGSDTSVIGLLTNATLDHTSDDYEWVDEGLVVESTGTQNYNCIDPNLVLDEDGVPWLSFGSHWSGIKMVRLDYETGLPSAEDDTVYEIAQRAIHPRAIEAPFIVYRDGYYYLFVSWDQCCSGVDSTYRVMVGRSESVTGPYVDKEGVDMMDDGGTQVTFPTERWVGPGHNGIYIEDDVYYMVYHSYDAENQGVPTLRINPLSWDEDGWPYLESME